MRATERRLAELLNDHGSAVREFIGRASAIDSQRWLIPRAEGKWTPAQETKHIVLSYQLFLRQLTDGTPIRLRGNAVQRVIWRFIGLNSILHLRRIPVAVGAPREARPEWIAATSEDLLRELVQLVEAFEAAFSRAWREEPRRRLTHHLFGSMSLDQGMRLLCVHTRHHATFLPRPSPSLPAAIQVS